MEQKTDQNEKFKYYLILFSNNLVRHFVFFFFPVFFLETGLNGFQSGLLMGIFTITGLLFSFHVGIKSDQIQQRTLLLVGTFIFIAFCFGLAYFTNIWMLVILFIVGGIGRLMQQRTTETLVLKSVDHDNKGKDMAMLSIMRCLPFAIGIIIGAYFISGFGFNFIFKISAILGLLVLIPVLMIKNTDLYNFSVHHYLDDFKNKKVLFFCLVVFIFSLHFGAEMTAYSLFLKQNLGLNLIQSSYYMAGVIVFLLISSFCAGRMIDRKYSKFKLMTYSMLLTGIGGALFAMTSNPILSFVWRSIHEIGDGIFLVVMSAGIISMFDRKRLGGSAGLVNVVIIFSTFLGSLIFGPIGFKYGYHLPHIISGILSIFAFVMMILIRKSKGFT